MNFIYWERKGNFKDTILFKRSNTSVAMCWCNFYAEVYASSVYNNYILLLYQSYTYMEIPNP